jgi:hypothetical protein
MCDFCDCVKKSRQPRRTSITIYLFSLPASSSCPISFILGSFSTVFCGQCHRPNPRPRLPCLPLPLHQPTLAMPLGRLQTLCSSLRSSSSAGDGGRFKKPTWTEVVLRSNNDNYTSSYAGHVKITWPIFFFLTMILFHLVIDYGLFTLTYITSLEK